MIPVLVCWLRSLPSCIDAFRRNVPLPCSLCLSRRRLCYPRLYSEQNVLERFSASPVHSANAEHFICAQWIAGRPAAEHLMTSARPRSSSPLLLSVAEEAAFCGSR